jgi:hypothetical protein
MGILFYFFMAFSGAFFFPGAFEHIDLHSSVSHWEQRKIMVSYSELEKVSKGLKI